MAFPNDFLWGISQSGFQFEMGNFNTQTLDTNTDWYAWVHDPSNIERGIVSGDFPENGIDYWHQYKKDHVNAQELGLNAYRISIEWSRIFPKSTFAIEVDIERDSDALISKIDIDQAAIEKLHEKADTNALLHYDTIINDLRARDFTVFICLNHFTLPLWIHDPIKVRNTKFREGPKGWLDDRTIIEFTKYAAYIAYNFGYLIDNWIPLNEPMVVAETGYLTDKAGFPPNLFNFKASKRVTINMINAHARAYDAIKKWDGNKADRHSASAAEVGVIQHVIPTKPFNAEKDSDIKAAEFVNHTHNQLFINAVRDGWLDKNLNGVKDKEEGKNFLGARVDFLGLNYYSRNIVQGKMSLLARLLFKIPVIPDLVEGYGLNCKPNHQSTDGKPTSDFGWEIYPEGIMEVIDAMKDYNLPIYITEHGLADERDAYRPKYIDDTVQLMREIIQSQTVNLKGYFHWSLNDNYEWAEGFKQKFGLHAVDRISKKRLPRQSSAILKRIITS